MESVLVHYSGRVQGVGFRYSCRNLARGFAVTGYVKNLPDGRVELVAQGERKEVEEFLETINQSDLKPFIKQRSEQWKATTTPLEGFYINH